MKKAFQMKSKAFFIDFEGLSFGEKKKIATTSFKLVFSSATSKC